MILTDEDIEAMRAGDDCGEAAPEFLRIVRIAEAAVLRKLRERPADAYIEHHKAGDNLIWTDEKSSPQVTPLHIIPEVDE